MNGQTYRSTQQDVDGVEPEDMIQAKELKSGKYSILAINKTTHGALNNYLAHRQPGPDEYLFANRKDNGSLTVSSANRLVKTWCKQVTLRAITGSHSLGKTFGYIQRGSLRSRV